MCKKDEAHLGPMYKCFGEFWAQYLEEDNKPIF